MSSQIQQVIPPLKGYSVCDNVVKVIPKLLYRRRNGKTSFVKLRDDLKPSQRLWLFHQHFMDFIFLFFILYQRVDEDSVSAEIPVAAALDPDTTMAPTVEQITDETTLEKMVSYVYIVFFSHNLYVMVTFG